MKSLMITVFIIFSINTFAHNVNSPNEENNGFWLIILSSSLISVVISTIVSTVVSFKLKHLEYRNEFYKIIINKRLNVYEHLERQLAVLKTSVFDDTDSKVYYHIFAYTESEFHEFQQNLMIAMNFSFWVCSDTQEKMKELSNVFFEISNKFDLSKGKDLIKAGKDYYLNINRIRNDLEVMFTKDMLKLYDVKSFIKKR